MTVGELSLALTVLRVVRGWNQDDLARAARIRNSAISDYERGKKLPELNTLQRLVDAMGYPLSALERAQHFIATLRSDSALAALGPLPLDGARAGRPRPEAEVDELPELDREAALRWEMEQVSAEAGRAISRVTRLLLLLLSQHAPPPSLQQPPEVPSSQET
jgi:transcriptional regulator with XRE-family HTH domain